MVVVVVVEFVLQKIPQPRGAELAPKPPLTQWNSMRQTPPHPISMWIAISWWPPRILATIVQLPQQP